MDDVVRKAKVKRSKALDRLLLIASSIAVAAVGVTAFAVADTHHATVWVFALVAALGFLAIIGRTFGIGKFRSPSFAVFAVVWLCIHVWLFLLVLGYLGFLYYVPLLIVDL